MVRCSQRGAAPIPTIARAESLRRFDDSCIDYLLTNQKHRLKPVAYLRWKSGEPSVRPANRAVLLDATAVMHVHSPAATTLHPSCCILHIRLDALIHLLQDLGIIHSHLDGFLGIGREIRH